MRAARPGCAPEGRQPSDDRTPAACARRTPRGCSASARARPRRARAEPHAPDPPTVLRAPPRTLRRSGLDQQRRTPIEHLRVRQQIGRDDRLAGPEVGIDLQRRIRAGDTGRRQDVSRLDERRNLARRLVSREDCRRASCRGVSAGRLHLLGTAADDEKTRVRPRPRQDRRSRRAACPGPDTARTCRCRARAAPRSRSPTATHGSRRYLGGSSTSPPITFSMRTARSPAPIAST